MAGLILFYSLSISGTKYIDIETMTNYEYHKSGASSYKDYTLKRINGINLEDVEENNEEHIEMYTIVYHDQPN